MTDFLLELRCEEIPARMQDKAREDLARLFVAELDKAGLKAGAVETFATPRRLTLIARGLPGDTSALLAEAVGKPEQVLSRSTVATLAARLAADPGPLPALIFYGSLAEIGGDGA